jgi:hypothetical protein
MTTQKLLVRVAPKSGATQFFRCGIRFTAEWQEVEVDAATAARLKAEQMLEARQGSGAGNQGSEGARAPAPQGLEPAAPPPAPKTKRAAKTPAADS